MKGPCPVGCRCGKHRPQAGRYQPKCTPDCRCGKHYRTPEHNRYIGESVALTAARKRR